MGTSTTPPLLLLLLFLVLSSAHHSSAAFSLDFSPIIRPIIDHLLPQPPAVPTPPPPPPGPTSFTGGKGRYRRMGREFLVAHNAVRASLGEVPVRWSRRLARYAQAWSDSLRDVCAIVHSDGPYGENMFYGSGWSWRAADAVAGWSSEIDFYDVESNTCLPGRMCGHFTQMAWNGTTRIGCGRAECYGGGVIITCSYDPPGNFVGERPFLLNRR